MTSTIEARDGETEVCRMPMGLDIVITVEPPVQLPGERPGPVGRQRQHRLTARDSGEYLFVGLRGDGGGTLPAREPDDIHLGPGDICFYDAHHPPALDFPEHCSVKVLLVPRELIGLEEADVQRIAQVPVTRSSRLGTLLSPFLSDLAHTASTSPSPVGEMLAWNTVNLLAILAAEQLAGEEPGTADVQSPLMPKIFEFIELHLTDTELSPEVIARAHHISVRYLHKLFQEEGTTVGRWIQRRRLEECRRDLVLRGRGNQTIAAVANRWGFLSATHFSRVFRTAYGMSPREWRDTATRNARSGRG
ncbi:helix-turn-helix transcriptional regulator [Streptomyces sp. NPDC001315]|uniref:AraC family transcriptional regulator n=1 Tax=Streptomyces sp. NPDC001315 TaxID=3364562 RepID=UPI003687B0FC